MKDRIEGTGPVSMPPKMPPYLANGAYNPEYLAHFCIVPYDGGGCCYYPHQFVSRGFALTDSQCSALVDKFLANEMSSPRVWLVFLLFVGPLFATVLIVPWLVEHFTDSLFLPLLAMFAGLFGILWVSNFWKQKRFLKVVPDAVPSPHGRPWRYIVLRDVAGCSGVFLALLATALWGAGAVLLLSSALGFGADRVEQVLMLFAALLVLLAAYAKTSAFRFGLRFRMKNGRRFTPADLPQISPVTGKIVPPM